MRICREPPGAVVISSSQRRPSRPVWLGFKSTSCPTAGVTLASSKQSTTRISQYRTERACFWVNWSGLSLIRPSYSIRESLIFKRWPLSRKPGRRALSSPWPVLGSSLSWDSPFSSPFTEETLNAIGLWPAVVKKANGQAERRLAGKSVTCPRYSRSS
jgi:hypothetical protein